eukprot:TRINITY_DN2198_c0_g1_i1.p3 TRINITY_DN2198_c0_g1~~TRINITY_DN2198_c0_g1_i1.p3  ORF type:complete len:329 (+),score=-3.82 TRINITY_DN2198_c0_g1_i1:1128-2114(+)
MPVNPYLYLCNINNKCIVFTWSVTKPYNIYNGNKLQEIMDNYMILPELPQPQPNIKELRIKAFDYYGKRAKKFWVSPHILFIPLILLAQIHECGRYTYVILILQHLPFLSFLGYYSYTLSKFFGSEGLYQVMVGTIACTVLCFIALCLKRRFQRRYLDGIFGIAIGILVLAVLVLSLVIFFLAWRSTRCLEEDKAFFLGVFALVSLVTTSGVVLMAFLLFVLGSLIEFVVRILMCKLTPCFSFEAAIILEEKIVKLMQLKTEELKSIKLSCSICMRDFESSEEVLGLNCHPLHIFHSKCIEKSLTSSYCCPICFNNVTFSFDQTFAII